MTYSPSPYQTTSMLQSDHKYFRTLVMLGDITISSEGIIDMTVNDAPTSIYSFLHNEVEEKLFNVYDTYCLSGYEDETLAMIQRRELKMSMVEFYTRQIRYAMDEIYDELKKRG
jgi:hypothetical protein